MRVINSVFRIENDILLLNTYFNSQMYKKYRNSLELNPTIKALHIPHLSTIQDLFNLKNPTQ